MHVGKVANTEWRECGRKYLGRGPVKERVDVERKDGSSEFRIREPAEVARALNQRFTGSLDSNQFFTFVYGILNLESREFCFTSAGHQPVLHQRANGSPTMLDIASYEIGMAPVDEEFDQQSVVLETGDRLLMYSDGLPDTMNVDGEVFGAARLLDAVSKLSDRSLHEMLRSLMTELGDWRGDADINDDVSVLAWEVA